MMDTADTIYGEEQRHLDMTRWQLTQVQEETQDYFDSLPGLYPNEAEIIMLNDLLTRTHNLLLRLKQMRENPYFARIDFAEEAESTATPYYLGKIGVLDGNDNAITLDWRAPVATLYYDSNVGPVSYEAPGGTIHGQLTLKRQLEIESGVLSSYRDVDTVANDDLLRPYLGVNADNRLKNIIATIQGEQNRIIRAPLTGNIIVQGAAGSGKTTVALHRIAYLVYNNRNTIKPGQYMVIGPNRFFINYISSVLPDLDVDSVPQYTYSDLVREILGESYTLTDSARVLSLAAAGRYQSQIEKYKVSLAYKQALDTFLADFARTLLPDGDFALRGLTILSHETLSEAWRQAMAGGEDTLRAKVSHGILYLNLYIENHLLELEQMVSAFFREQYQQPGVDLNKIHKDRAYVEKELASGCGRSLKAFFNKIDVRMLALYRQFVQGFDKYGADFAQADVLKKQTLARLRKKEIDPEDQPALLYLQACVNGCGSYKTYRHTVIDEAQDFGAFDFYVLQKILSACSFTIVGDLAQAIYGYRSIDGWESVVDGSFGGQATLALLQKSYRNTVEIMEAANLVTGHLGMAPATPVIRYGAPVGVYPATSAQGQGDLLAALISSYQQEGLDTIALLAKTEEDAAHVAEELATRGLSATLITGDSTVYGGGLCVMPGYLSKGLEFDAVVLCDAGNAKYSDSQRVDMHLLYVSMTRALHRLDILHMGDLAVPLRTLTAH